MESLGSGRLFATCGDKESCLEIVDRYLEGQPRAPGREGASLLQTFGRAPPQGGGPCGALCELHPLCVSGTCRFDPYDNAVAAIYLVRRGRLEDAERILNALKGLLYPGEQQRLELVRSAYSSSGEVLDWNVDTGNNAWVGMAFAHYSAASGSACYAAISRDILRAIASQVGCSDHLGGYMGRMPRGRGHYRATEHNIDMYAFAKMLNDSAVQASAGRFIEGMYGFDPEHPEVYATGTGGSSDCDASRNGMPIAADTQIWNLLAEADLVPERKRASLAYVLRPAAEGGLRVEDTDSLGDGARLMGVRFTSRGSGAQWENTASTAIGVGLYRAKFGEDLANANETRYMEDALMHQLSEYGAVLGSVRGGNYNAYVQGDRSSPFPGGSDTGMGWAYLRYPHTAATAWTGLVLMEANPFAPPPEPVPAATAEEVHARCFA